MEQKVSEDRPSRKMVTTPRNTQHDTGHTSKLTFSSKLQTCNPANRRILKRIGSKPIVRAFSKQFASYPIQQPDNFKENISQKDESENINREVYMQKKTSAEDNSPEKKMKRIGKKIWVSAYKDQLQQQNDRKQFDLLRIPLSEYSNHSSFFSNGKTTSINSKDKYRSKFSRQKKQSSSLLDDFSEFHEGSIEQISSSQCNYSNLFDEDEMKEEINDGSKKGRNRKEQNLLINDWIKGEDQYEINVLMNNKPSVIYSDESFTEALKLSSSLSSFEDQQGEKGSKAEQKLGFTQESKEKQQEQAREKQKLEEKKDIERKVLKEYEIKINKYMQQSCIKRPSLKKTAKATPTINYDRGSKKKIQTGTETQSKQRNKKKKNSIIRKPLPPAYPFNQETRLLSSVPVKTDELNKSLKQSMKFSGNKISESTGLNQPLERSVQNSGQLQKKNFKKPTPPILEHNRKNMSHFRNIENRKGNLDSENVSHNQSNKISLEKINSKSMHTSAQKPSKANNLSVSKLIQNAKRQLKNNSLHY